MRELPERIEAELDEGRTIVRGREDVEWLVVDLGEEQEEEEAKGAVEEARSAADSLARSG